MPATGVAIFLFASKIFFWQLLLLATAIVAHLIVMYQQRPPCNEFNCQFFEELESMAHFNGYCHPPLHPRPVIVELQISEGFEGGERLVTSSYLLGFVFLASFN